MEQTSFVHRLAHGIDVLLLLGTEGVLALGMSRRERVRALIWHDTPTGRSA